MPLCNLTHQGMQHGTRHCPLVRPGAWANRLMLWQNLTQEDGRPTFNLNLTGSERLTRQLVGIELALICASNHKLYSN